MLFSCDSRSQSDDRRTERKKLLPAGVRDCLGTIKFLSRVSLLTRTPYLKGDAMPLVGFNIASARQGTRAGEHGTRHDNAA